ncbi:MAG: YdbL family protein [Methylococcaceae bacterium]
MRTVSFFSALFLTACVTINIYFPAAAAEQVADEIIRGIQTEDDPVIDQSELLSPQSKVNGYQRVVYQWIDNALNVVISPVHAAADLSVNTSEIRRLRAAMQTRFSSLKVYYAQGLVGIKSDGFIVGKGAAPLKDRNKVKKLIAAENADRKKLYQAIANANGHPEWFRQIKLTFATRWMSNAKSGWWYQTSNGSWKQK